MGQKSTPSGRSAGRAVTRSTRCGLQPHSCFRSQPGSMTVHHEHYRSASGRCLRASPPGRWPPRWRSTSTSTTATWSSSPRATKPSAALEATPASRDRAQRPAAYAWASSAPTIRSWTARGFHGCLHATFHSPRGGPPCSCRRLPRRRAFRRHHSQPRWWTRRAYPGRPCPPPRRCSLRLWWRRCAVLTCSTPTTNSPLNSP
mmetsp:Transcript_24637/g.76221  ORF Transcript_24637/g.76221 Transcript_24637/m.76221 type:complete len:202 (-) Transcript_24637:11-616(-)